MEKTIDWKAGAEALKAYVDSLVSESNAVIKEKPHLLQAFSDYMDVTHKEVDPKLKEKWEHNAMWLLHRRFMEKANAFQAKSPAYRKEISELITIMKLITQTVDLALLPEEHRKIVEEWATRYKKYFK